MERKILECVPNFSEGRDLNIIRQIAGEITSVGGVMLLGVDSGRDANRTVVTFAGAPDATVEAAFLAVKKAAALIDMSKHHGEHPRMGAIDVCPLIPVSGITMEEAAVYARRLASRIGEDLSIPVYCYENAAFTAERKNLANCRAGQYEGLQEKLSDIRWKPDFGPAEFNRQSGATAVGARDFLVAYNINLDTVSVSMASTIASNVREKGKPAREGNRATGKILKDENGHTVMIPGSLKAVKAIGWFMEEYGIAQVSMNLTDLSKTPVHIAFDEVCKQAAAHGTKVTGSELVGLIPLKPLLDAGRYFSAKQQLPSEVSDDELVRVAIESLGLNDVKPFDPDERIIEYVMAKQENSGSAQPAG
ncbi:MAG: glutamate formimidoyltransferase [Bacteroidales bacterium]|jgi:glutamate formiminotransferase/formiminotetrahydrofolate cyclodeaminase|nr:glutamate formimidoyltransferase [Bacteroidales bacterium]